MPDSGFDRVVRFVTETDLVLPTSVRDEAYNLVADCIGCGLAAASRRSDIDALIEAIGPATGVCRVLGRDLSTSPGTAALLNGYLCHALDYDDYTLSSWIGHPSVVLLPALAAVAEVETATYQRLIEAYVIGYEVGARVGLATGNRQYELGWHNTSTIGVLAATAALAHLLRFTAKQTESALGFAASQTGGLKRNFGTTAKPLHAGLAAEAAVRSVLWVRYGLTAAADAWTGPQGVLAALCGVADKQFDQPFAAATANLGSSWDLIEPGVGMKPYPSCAYSHWAIDAALALRGQSIVVDQIERIELVCATQVQHVCIHHHPATGTAGKFSLQYCVATTLLNGRPGLDDFGPEPITAASVCRLMPKVVYDDTEPWEHVPWGGKLRCRLQDATIREIEIREALGSPGNPLDEPTHRAKFMDCTAAWSGAAEKLYASLLQPKATQMFSLPGAGDAEPVL